MSDVLNGLNDAQKNAVASSAKVLQVLAPPGSGKTKTLTARVAYLIARQGIQPWNIIVCTFTVKAATEMKQRITSFVGEELARQLKLGTFHSVALRYLKHYGHHIGLSKDFGIADTNDCRAILKRLIKKLGLSIEPGPAMGRISTRKVKGTIPSKDPKDSARQEFDELFSEYEAALAASNLLDYDDLLLRCCDLLRDHPLCVANVQAVLIDEFQDTNNTQFDLMSLFAQRMNVITIVGDPDQSIYGFRLAEIQNLARMKSRWPDTLTINLEENYRSSGAILHAAQKIIEQDTQRPSKKLQATHSFGLRPILRKLPSSHAEADWIVSEVRRIQAMTGTLLQLNDIAILLRSATLSRSIETALGNAGIPYRMVGGTKFYDRLEVKLLVDYLRVVHQSSNAEALERIINVPSRRIGDQTIKQLREESQLLGISLWDLVVQIAQSRRVAQTKLSEPARKGLSSFTNVILSARRKMALWETESPSVADLLALIAQKINLQSFLKLKYTEEETFEARWANVEEFMAQAADVSSPERLAELVDADDLPHVDGISKMHSTAQDVLSTFLANISLTAAAEKQADKSGERAGYITISTIHAAKGLEWPIVFVPSCFDGSIPHSRAEDHDEERRLLYVAMTRAQVILYLSCPIKNTQREETNLSTFLTQPGVHHFFEEHGPSLPYNAMKSLSTTLRRALPDEAMVVKMKSSLAVQEDNYWPLNGEEPHKHAFPTPYPQIGNDRSPIVGSTHQTMQLSETMQCSSEGTVLPAKSLPGFASVSARYEELLEQYHLRKVDKRAEKPSGIGLASKGRKRQIDGQAEISCFFGKRAKPQEPEHRRSPVQRPAMEPKASAVNVPPVYPARDQALLDSSLLTHKPRTTRISHGSAGRRVDHDQENRDTYIFLSSSPVRETHVENVQEEREASKATSPPAMRPANTLHTTSIMQGKVPRRTLGVRRSLHGWSGSRKP